MLTPLRYCILGTGAVGGYYGAKLDRSGQDVSFLLRSDYGYVKEHGLRIDSINGDFILKSVKAFDDVRQIPKCDVAVVAWKSTENERLAGAVQSVLKPNGILVVLQNGLDPEREFADCVPDSLIMGGLCFIAARKQGPGWIVHQAFGAVTFCDYPKLNLKVEEGFSKKDVTDRLRRVEKDFQNAEVETHWHEDWQEARWSKLVWNIPFNGLCALLKTNTYQLMQIESMRLLIQELMDEVVCGAKACGVVLAKGIIESMINSTDRMLPYEPSMKLDCDSGRPLELHAIYKRPIEEIKKAGGSAPRIEMLLTQLQFLTMKVD